MSKEKEMTAEEMAAGDKGYTSGIQFPANKVQEGLSRLQVEGKINAEEADLILWLYSFAQEKNLTYRGVAGLLGKSTSVAYRVIHCDYPASYEAIIEEIRKVKRHVAEEAKKKSIGFVETATAKKIFEGCDAALYDHMPVFIYGVSQSGKTFALKEYQLTHNHGTTKYLRVGARWTKARFVMELAIACRCYSSRATTAQLEHRICGALNDRNLLIIDEFHEALFTTSQTNSLEIVEFIREVYDRTGCGIVMASTPMGAKEFEEGRNQVAFEQLRRRGIVKLVIPEVPKVADINTFAKSFDLPAPKGEILRDIKLVLKSHGLGKFVKFLQKAYSMAKNEKRQLSWDDFLIVNNGLSDLSKASNEY